MLLVLVLLLPLGMPFIWVGNTIGFLDAKLDPNRVRAGGGPATPGLEFWGWPGEETLRAEPEERLDLKG